MNPGTDTVLIAALIVLFLVAVVLGAAEAALIRVPKAQVAVAAENGDGAAARLLRLIDDLPLALNSILLVVLLAQIGAATVVGVLSGRHFGGLGVTVVSIGLTLALFVYAEAIPKTIAVRAPLRVARLVVPIVTFFIRLLRPLTRILVAFADLQAPGRGVAGRLGVSEEELRYLAREAVEAGEIEQTDRELIERGFDFGDTVVSDILVPRPDIVAVERDASVQQALDVAVAAGHRRLPVHQGELDSVVGVVRLRDLAAALSGPGPQTVGDLMGPALVIPESKRVVDALREMQAIGRHMAIVIDEHGGTAGLVTIEDIAEELVGRITDEDAPRHEPYRRLAPGRWEVSGRCSLRDLENLLGIELPAGAWRTVAGLLLHLAGGVPAPGDTFTVADHRIEVIEASERRVRRVVVERIDSNGPSRS